MAMQNDDIIAEALVDHMVKTGVKALGFIGLADPYGENWYKVVTSPGVRFGMADPRFDSAGYRSLMVLQLAEDYCHDPIILEDLSMNGLSTPIVSEQTGDLTTITVPELSHRFTPPIGQRNIRFAAIDAVNAVPDVLSQRPYILWGIDCGRDRYMLVCCT